MSLAEAVSAEKELDAAIKEIKRELRNHRKREAHGRQMPAQVWAAATILLCRTGGDVKLLAIFLQWKAGRSKGVLQTWVATLMAWYDQCDPEKIQSLAAGPYTAQELRASKVLDAFLRERELHCWVQKQNEEHGITPSTGVMLQQLTARSLGGKATGQCTERSKYRSSLQYLRRWRGRWGVSRSSLHPLEVVPLEVLKVKVATCSCLPGFGDSPKFEHVPVPRAKKWCRLAAPFLDPQIENM